MSAGEAWVETDDEIRTILRRAKTIALVGASPKPWRDSGGIMQALLDAGFDVIPVNPNYAEVLGRPCVPNLSAVGRPIDIVNVFRRPSALLDLVREAIGVRAACLWLQPGALDSAAARAAAEAGMVVIAGRCIAVERRRLLHGPAASAR